MRIFLDSSGGPCPAKTIALGKPLPSGGTPRRRPYNARMRLSLIVAMTRNGVIGRGGGLPWKLSADLKRFKALTMGHHIIMGRKTFESLGKLLPGRIMVVLSRGEAGVEGQETGDRAQGTADRGQGTGDSRRQLVQSPCFVRSLDEALRLAGGDEEVFVIGGAVIFELALSRVDRMYVTWVEADVEGDVTFPQVDWGQWREIRSERHPADGKNEYETTFCVYERVPR